MAKCNSKNKGHRYDDGGLGSAVGSVTTMFGQPEVAAAIEIAQLIGGAETAIGNKIRNINAPEINNSAVADYLNSNQLIGDAGKQQALDSIRSGVQDLGEVNNFDSLYNIGTNQQDTVQNINYAQDMIGSGMEFVGNLHSLNLAGAYGTARRAMERTGAELGLWDSRSDIANKEINRANLINDTNYKNQIVNIAENNTFKARRGAEGGSLPINKDNFDEGNGITSFNVGNSHDDNKYGGIQQGIASDNLPNLVEQGEKKYKDYIFSARLKVNKTLLKENLLPESLEGLSFADACDKLQKESEDRPNDPISLRTLDDWMKRLATAQEEYKTQKEERALAREFDKLSDDEKEALMSTLAQGEDVDLGQPMYKSGGKIYIKPSHRGKFTALKKRTGKSASWFKAHGTPAQKKMATFALNAKKWKHDDGGHLYQYGDLLGGVDIIDKRPDPVIIPEYYPGVPEMSNKYYFGELQNAINNIGSENRYGEIEPIPQLQKPGRTKVRPTKEKQDVNIDWSGLRFAPAVGATLGMIEAGLQPKDYTLANQLRDIASQYKPMAASYLGNYEKYTPYDINLGDAENIALQAAALEANRGQNRSTQGALNAALMNTAQKTAAQRNLAWQQANEARRQAVDRFNLGIDQTNAGIRQTYDQLNTNILNQKLAMLARASQAEDLSKQMWAENVNSTVENFWNQLGNVGKDQWNANQTQAWLDEYKSLLKNNSDNKGKEETLGQKQRRKRAEKLAKDRVDFIKGNPFNNNPFSPLGLSKSDSDALLNLMITNPELFK